MHSEKPETTEHDVVAEPGLVWHCKFTLKAEEYEEEEDLKGAMFKQKHQYH